MSYAASSLIARIVSKAPRKTILGAGRKSYTVDSVDLEVNDLDYRAVQHGTNSTGVGMQTLINDRVGVRDNDSECLRASL